MDGKNIILAHAPFNVSWWRNFGRSGGHAVAVCARWIAARCNARRSCCAWRIHTPPLGALGLPIAPIRDLDRQHGRGPSPCDGANSALVFKRTGDEP
jgi:hypothetical protein